MTLAFDRQMEGGFEKSCLSRSDLQERALEAAAAVHEAAHLSLLLLRERGRDTKDPSCAAGGHPSRHRDGPVHLRRAWSHVATCSLSDD